MHDGPNVNENLTIESHSKFGEESAACENDWKDLVIKMGRAELTLV